MADNYGWEDDHVPPGDGTVDLPAIIRKLLEAGYSGVWCLEIGAESTGRPWTINEFIHRVGENMSRIFNGGESERNDEKEEKISVGGF